MLYPMILGTRRGVLFNLKEYILPYIDIYTYSYLRRQGQLARDGESATGVIRGVYVHPSGTPWIRPYVTTCLRY